jgi:hypothetical protein
MSGTAQQPATEHNTSHDVTNRSSDHAHHAPTDTPDRQDDNGTEHADAHTIPSPRQSAAAPSQRPAPQPEPHRRRNRPARAAEKAESRAGPDASSPVTNQTPATLTAGPDGALWVTVDGADIQQLADRISAVCDVLASGPATPPMETT